jgi:hypothetical protein
MSNTIDQNLRDSNSMKSLSFYWLAEFNNGVIFQFDESGEHKFREVLNRINELEFFYLYHKKKSLRFIVDLKKGFIKFNDISEPTEVGKKENIRLIYFRRHKIEITENCIEKLHNITYYLGFQYNDKLGNNQKIIFQIDEIGNWSVGE